mmetsp:Transcript_48205/g.127656  ORF Transcript_48205/g.127656 Transcript_48205/m.127656 type:complete len:205 (+) Transcript_48205:722-1336(+)
MVHTAMGAVRHVRVIILVEVVLRRLILHMMAPPVKPLRQRSAVGNLACVGSLHSTWLIHEVQTSVILFILLMRILIIGRCFIMCRLSTRRCWLHIDVRVILTKDLHIDLDVQTKITYVSFKLMLQHQRRILVGNLLGHNKESSAAIGPHLVLAQQKGKEQEYTSIRHNPPYVHCSREAVCEGREPCAFDDHHHLVKDHSDLHEA